MTRENTWRKSVGAGLALCGYALALLTLTGCGPSERLETVYGRTGGVGGKSVNGVSVLAGMFAERGNKVMTVTRLTPRLDKVDVIVWAPNDFQPPTTKQREFLEKWLAEGSDRTLVYIGRDYDAACTYWKKSLPLAPPERAAEFQRRQAKAVTDFDAARQSLPSSDTYARWFKLKTGGLRRKATTLSGPWASDVDPQKAEIELATRLAVPQQADVPTNDYDSLLEFETLLSAGEDPLVLQAKLRDGQVITVANGSFLLNLPLVNKEHRKLAGKLIDQCNPYDIEQNIAFIESDAGGPAIRTTEDLRGRSGFEMFTVWPLGPIVVHTVLWLLVCCVCCYPIFGRPRGKGKMSIFILPTPVPMALLLFSSSDQDGQGSDAPGDFGLHLTAMGELLSLTKDAAYATEKIRYYQQNVKRESGVSHIGPPATQKKS